MSKVIDQAAGETHVVDNFLVGVDGSDRRCDAEAWRSRIATKHRMCPVDSSVEDCDVYSLAFVAFTEVVKRSEFLILTVGRRSVDVVDTLFELKPQRASGVNTLYLRHCFQRGDD